MSQKQLRKLRELQAKQPEPELSSEEAELPSATARSSNFDALAALAASSESEEVLVPLVRPAPKRRRKPRPKSPDSEELLEAPVEAEAAEDVARPRRLALRREDFSMAAERRRVFGRMPREAKAKRGRGPEGRTLHHRRLFLVEPEEPWVRAETWEMVACEDGSFDLRETARSKRSLEMLRNVVSHEDPELLQHFLQRSPFEVDGLLVLAEHQRRQGGFEQCRDVRRAVYALECGISHLSRRASGRVLEGQG